MRTRTSITVALLLWASCPAVDAANFTVGSTTDPVDANPGDGTCETTPDGGVCTLRAA
jgi:hypothetical protein